MSSSTSHKYSILKVFHFPEKLASLSQESDEILPPIHIRIKPTNHCNHRCYYCCYRDENQSLGQDMKETDFIPWVKMLEIVVDLGAMGVKAVTFSGGGDPFCYPYLMETATALRVKGIDFAALTNGGKLEGAAAIVFAFEGTWLRVSIDGWDDVSYSSYRGVPEGEFTKVMKNMEAFKNLGGQCLLGASIIVDLANASEIYGLIRRLKNVGCDSVKVSGVVTSDDGAVYNQYHGQILKVVKGQMDRAMDLADDDFEIYNTYHLMEGNFDKDYDWCPYHQILMGIGADLNVYTCQDKAYTKSGLLGSIKNQRFRDFWMKDKSKFFRINPSADCKHHCVNNAKNKMVVEHLSADVKHVNFI